MTVPAGHRFEATQALRQVLNRAVEWRMIEVNPAKHGVDNPQRRRTEKRPFESWTQLALARLHTSASGDGALVMFAAATGLRPGEWIALDERDIIGSARGRLRAAGAPERADQVPQDRGRASERCRFQTIALEALDQLPAGSGNRPSLFSVSFAVPTSTSTTSARASGSPLRLAAGITPIRRIYDLRHTFATFALRAGVSTYELSRYMGASLSMIDRQYGHLARDGREHAINLLDKHHGRGADADVHAVDIAWTPHHQAVAS